VHVRNHGGGDDGRDPQEMTSTSDAGLLAAARTDPHAFRELYE
jgi:hypothetical protein